MDDLVSQARDVLDEIEDDMIKDGKSADFVEEMRGRFEAYGDRTFVSQKQLDWLISIRDRQ